MHVHTFLYLLYLHNTYDLLPLFSADISNLADILLDIHHVAPKWKDVGLLLRLHPHDLGLIEADNVQKGVTSCLRVVVEKWLNQSYDTATYGLPSWKMLVDAIAHPVGGNNPALAEQIATKHKGAFVNVTLMNIHVCILAVSIYVYAEDRIALTLPYLSPFPSLSPLSSLSHFSSHLTSSISI